MTRSGHTDVDVTQRPFQGPFAFNILHRRSRYPDIIIIHVRCALHLESVEVGYSDIFVEYASSIYLTTRSICLEYSDIYLEYVNPFPIPGICLEYA